jgi:hypothetical protein
MAIANAGTATIDIDVTQPLTELDVVIGLTNAGARTPNLPIHTQIARIELVDGGTVYASMDGPQVCAAFCYEAGKYPPVWTDQRANAGQGATFPIRFGRYLGDPLRNFDPTKLRNPQIRITWINNALHLAGSKTLGIRGKIMDGVPGASSCLFTTAVRTFVTAAAGIEVTELPTDYPIRKLYVQAEWYRLSTPTAITWLRLDCDEGKFIAFDNSGWDLAEWAEEEFGQFQMRQWFNVNSLDWLQTWLGMTYGAVMNTETANTFVNGRTTATNAVQVVGASDAGVALALADVECVGIGVLPHDVYVYTFGVQDDPASWFNAGAYRKVKLNLTQGFAGINCTILVQQDRPM